MQRGAPTPAGPRIDPLVGETLTRLARVTGELSSATRVDEVTKIVTQHMADAIGASIASLALRDGEADVRLLGTRGLEATEAARWQTFPMDLPNAITEVIRTGDRLVLVGSAAITARYPGTGIPDRGERSTVTIPLRVAGRTSGAIHLSIPGARRPHPAELEFLDIVADACAQAFERIESVSRAEQQTARLAFLAEASTQLASSLDLEVTTQRVARLAVPSFADWCAIDLVRDGSLRRLAVAHVDPAKVELARRMHDRWPPDPSEPSGAMDVVRTGRPLLVPDVTDEMLVASSRDAEQLAVARELELRSALVVPLLVRGRVSGLLTWVSTSPDRRYTEDDVRFAEHVARRSAAALDNAELYSQTRDVAEQLQQAVLPGRIAGTAHWEAHASYRPSGRTGVGGDFYDAFALDDRRYVAFVGDVMGRGVAAAAEMAQMRAAVRAFVSGEPSPESVVEHLDRMLRLYETDQLVTLALVLADAESPSVRVVNAGHVPLLVRRRDGRVEQLPDADGPPLGLADRRRAAEVAVGAGDLILVVTDGLVERRGESIDVGLARLSAALADLDPEHLEESLTALVDEVADPDSEDDVAALVLRRSRGS